MKQKNESSLADVFENSKDIDYQLKTAELVKEQIFLQKYTPLNNNAKLENNEKEREDIS